VKEKIFKFCNTVMDGLLLSLVAFVGIYAIIQFLISVPAIIRMIWDLKYIFLGISVFYGWASYDSSPGETSEPE